MPLQKVAKKREPLWKEWDKLAQKEGTRKTFYAVGGDEYTGDWHDNKKHGMQMKRVLQPFSPLVHRMTTSYCILQVKVFRYGSIQG